MEAKEINTVSPFQGLCYFGGGGRCYKRFTLSGLK
jgi:hypothetical protein